MNVIISFVIWIYQNTLLRILPNDLPFFSCQTYAGILASAKANLIVPLSQINFIFPMDLLLIIVELIIAMELILLGVKMAIFLINVFRGAGA